MRMPTLKRLYSPNIFIALLFAGLLIPLEPAHAISDRALYQACADAEGSGTRRRAAQIRNFRFAYEINRSQRDAYGVPLSMESIARSRANLIEVCRALPDGRAARG